MPVDLYYAWEGTKGKWTLSTLDWWSAHAGYDHDDCSRRWFFCCFYYYSWFVLQGIALVGFSDFFLNFSYWLFSFPFFWLRLHCLFVFINFFRFSFSHEENYFHLFYFISWFMEAQFSCRLISGSIGNDVCPWLSCASVFLVYFSISSLLGNGHSCNLGWKLF